MGNISCKDRDKYEKITYLSKSGSSKVYLLNSKRKRKSEKQKVCKEFKTTIDIHNPCFTEIIFFLKTNPHKNIIEVHEIKFDFNKPILYKNTHLPSISIFMEYIEHDLFEYHTTNHISYEAKKNIGYDIVEAVEYLHSNNIVHGDLKLENMMIDKKNTVKLIDFEASVYTNSCTLDLSLLKSTMDYLSPEKYLYQNIGLYNDIWSLGLVLYLLFEYELPFQLKDLIINEGKTPEILFTIKDHCFKDLIFKMLNSDPEERLTIKEVKEHVFWI